MTTRNPMSDALTLVRTKYSTDTAMVAIADALMVAQSAAEARIPRTDISPLAGYRKGAQGYDGYSPLNALHGSLLHEIVSEAGALLEVGVLLRVLVVALQRMGETIEY